mmetsp:Transcript_17896/g.29927  ORF Transcript_17896/g.29927 Transcript_17896/m.29927 type:complete len:459 (-) Transcript_17896:1327-2703(-)
MEKIEVIGAPAAAVFTASTFCWLTLQHLTKISTNNSEFSSPTATVMKLATEEETRLSKYPPASSITFYEGSSAPPTEYLRGRVREIIACNPYLTLRLKKPKKFSSEVLAPYDLNPQTWQLSDYFNVVLDSSIDRHLPYNELMLRVDKYQTKFGSKCINRNEVVFKVTLIVISSTSYALVVSLNHMIGDGFTFYKLSGMLSANVTPYTFDPVRNHSFKEEVEKLLCPHFLRLLQSPLLLIGFLYNKLMHYPLKPYICVIDKSFVEAEKMKYQLQNQQSLLTDSVVPPNPAFISTNDILMSWFVKFSQCSFAGMVVNFRNRMEGYTDHMAGNYTKSVIFRASDIQQPQDIRQSLQKLDLPPPYRCVGGNSSPDTMADSLALITLNFAGVTNWASFYEDVVLPDSEVVVHLPIMNLGYMSARSALIIFKCNKNDTAVALWSASALTPNELRSEAIISRNLS